MPLRTLTLVALLGASGLCAQEPTTTRLEAMQARDPRDPIVLLRLAVTRASEGKREEALDLLEPLAKDSAGLDPSALRGLESLHGEPAFQRVVAAIRAAHPPRLQSRSVATITERDLRPEGLAFDPGDRATYLGSAKGRILRIDRRGQVADFARIDGAPWILGLRVDVRRRQLWAVVDDPRVWADPAFGGSSLHCYDLRSGRRLRAVSGPAFGALNDLVVTKGGALYATNTSDGSVWRVPMGASAVEAFLPPGSVLEANGLALSGDERLLFVAGWHDVHRVDLRTGDVQPLVAGPGIAAGNLDGLYVHHGALLGIQNDLHPSRVLRFHLDSTRRRIFRQEVLEAYHPEADTMTTGALDGDTFLFIRNPQMSAFGAGGTLKPGRALQDLVLARLPLR